MFDPILIPIIFVSSIPVIAIGVPLARAFAKRIEAAPSTTALPHELTSRLDRMEQAIDTIAVEMERVSEGQRFTTKLLTERAVEKSAVRAGGEPG